jgi:hypothetical protein
LSSPVCRRFPSRMTTILPWLSQDRRRSRLLGGSAEGKRPQDVQGARPRHRLFRIHGGRAAIHRWFADLDCGISGDRVTVAAACKLHVEDRRREKGDTCGQDANMRFQRTVYRTALGDHLIR